MEMMIIKINKSLPIPKDNERKWQMVEEMSIGDSFIMPRNPQRNIANELRCMRGLLRRQGILITIRKLPNGDYRIWRKA